MPLRHDGSSHPICIIARRVARLLAVWSLLHASTALAAVPAVLAMEDAVSQALASQPQLTAQHATILALREESVAARQWPDPKLVLGIEGLPVNSFSLTREDMTQTVFGVSQMIPGGDKAALAGRRFEHQASRAEFELEASRRRIARDVRLAWLERYWPQAAIQLVSRIEAEYALQEEWSRVAYAAGKLPQDEALALRGMREALRNRITDLEGQRARAAAGLGRWLGMEAGGHELAELPGSINRADFAPNIDGHPELRALQASLEAGHAETEMARQARKPDWAVDLSYGIRGEDRVDTLKLMVGVDLPLFPKQRQDRRLAARLAEIAGMEAMLEDRRRMLAADLAASQAEWRSADVRLARLDTDILPRAEQRLDSLLSASQSGAAGFDRVLEARRALLETRLEQLDLNVARAKAAVMLKYYE